MVKVMDRPIIIQKINEESEKWENAFNVHARINKAKTDSEFLGGGSVQGKRSLVFEIRYFKALEDISYNLSMYRILFEGVTFDITDYDDFMLRHKTVKLMGVSY